MAKLEPVPNPSLPYTHEEKLEDFWKHVRNAEAECDKAEQKLMEAKRVQSAATKGYQKSVTYLRELIRGDYKQGRLFDVTAKRKRDRPPKAKTKAVRKK